MTTTTETSIQIRRQIQEFAFTPLFTDALGWDHFNAAPLMVTIGEQTYTLRPVAQKRGVVALRCEPDTKGGVPDYATRKLIDVQARRTYHEHFIIYTDRDNTMQVWQWVKRQDGRVAYREQRYFKGQSGEALAQRLAQLYVDLLEEESLTLTDVTGRIQQSFDVDKVTKRFYDRFKTEHKAFLDAIIGIETGQGDREWYASLMLNRLMFTYFIQRQGFLAGDAHYLRTKLAATRARFGADQFHSFYREFLIQFFHKGLGAREDTRSAELRELIGNVPYLNGGLFEEHSIERNNPAIVIPDVAFEHVFAFFDEFNWHLDDRPTGNDKEINPDVLGYIFEKYINQKQMGAYYTKEDITGYISRNTILPFLLDATRKGVQTAFDKDGEVWRLLRDDPDRYIYDAVRKGVDIPLPAEIAAGISEVAQRGSWNRPAAPEYALPTETWREHVARCQRCLDLRAKLAEGEVHEVNDLITYNLDIVQFAQDVIERCEGPEVVRAFWKALVRVTVLDPTCGSGAFLFAALRILEPLYDACLTRMQAFITQFDREGERQKGKDFRETLADVSTHPSRAYFIRKRIILNNLYGVDIMEEAVEIAKLRLFLALVSQAQSAARIEPLPDIDFNIRAGNTLVGFATYAEAERAVSGHVFWHAEMPEIKRQAEDLARLFALFREQQTAHGGRVTKENKDELRDRLAALGDKLDRFLAAEYGIDENHYPNSSQLTVKMDAWRKSHQPFHWFIEFYDIVQERGGFDVIIGNPPYVEYYEDKFVYKLRGYATLSCANLYPCIVERTHHLLAPHGTESMILPLSAFATKNMAPFIHQFEGWFPSAWLSFYHFRPSMLFSGGKVASIPTTIFLGQCTDGQKRYTTGVTKWIGENRDYVFPTLAYANVTVAGDPENTHYFPKFERDIENEIMDRVLTHQTVRHYLSPAPTASKMWYRSAGGLYWKVFVNFPWPYKTTSNKVCSFLEQYPAGVLVSLFNSSLFWWYYTSTFDTFNLKDYMLFGFRFDFPSDGQTVERLAALADQLMADFSTNADHLKRGETGSFTIYARKSKPIIDEIDRTLAEHYGFTDEELDFIINYDIKYRMGAESGDDEGDGEA